VHVSQSDASSFFFSPEGMNVAAAVAVALVVVVVHDNNQISMFFQRLPETQFDQRDWTQKNEVKNTTKRKRRRRRRRRRRLLIETDTHIFVN